MMKTFVVLSGIALLLSGCYRTVYRGEDLGGLVAMNRIDPGNETVVDHFEDEVWNHYFVYGLAPTVEPNLKQIIGRHVPPGYEVRNLRIRHEMTFVNGLVGVFA